MALYDVGVAPGDFAMWNACEPTGDLNFDNTYNFQRHILQKENLME